MSRMTKGETSVDGRVYAMRHATMIFIFLQLLEQYQDYALRKKS